MLKRLLIVSIAVVLAALLWAGTGLTATANPTAAALTILAPQNITESFYEWYLEYLTPDLMFNPLLDGEYHDSDYLTSGMVSRVDSMVQGAYGLGLAVDPFLCTNDIPLRISTQFSSLSEKDATVLLRGSFPTESQITETRTLAAVHLVPVDGHWNIDLVVCR